MRDMTSVARVIATLAHLGQTDKSGHEYIRHPERVAASVAAFAPDDWKYEAEQVAWLHDVVEDTSVTLNDLRDLGFSEDVVSGVDAMTKRKGEDMEDYFARVRSNPLARIVKHADIDDNINPGRLALLDEPTVTRLVKKYTRSRNLLKGTES